MKYVLRWMLVGSVMMTLLMGGLLYLSYKQSQETDTTLLELSTTLYQNPIQTKEGRVDEVASNLIYYVNEENTLQSVFLEVLSCKEGTLQYIEIPMNTQICVGAKLYQKLAASYPNLPQYFQLSTLGGLFDESRRYAYGQLILDDYLSIDSSYYTVIKGTQATFQDYLESLKSQGLTGSLEKIEDWIEQTYSKSTSNLSKQDKLEYATYYAKVGENSLIYTTAEGTVHADWYEIDLSQFYIDWAGLMVE